VGMTQTDTALSEAEIREVKARPQPELTNVV
jgi:hypothetical protein